MTAIDVESVEEVGTDLVHAPPAALFATDDPVEVVEKATRVADALKAVIVAKGLFTLIQGKAHIGVEAWTLCGAMLGVTAICTNTEAVDGGYKATVEARNADGRVIGRADALCTKHEKRGPWKNADDYARLSMAQTRATSKALKGPLGFIVSLAGYQTTPSEEMTFVAPDPAPAAEPAVMVDENAAKQLTDQFARFTESGLGPDEVAMKAASLGVDFNAGTPETWTSFTRDQGRAIYKWMGERIDVDGVPEDAA